jgi:hypothetical protein
MFVFNILTVVAMKNAVFRDVKSYNSVDAHVSEKRTASNFRVEDEAKQLKRKKHVARWHFILEDGGSMLL